MSAPGSGYPALAVAHVHSTHSDGTATVAELRSFVRAAGARVLLLTDHDSLGARRAGEDGWGDDVLVVCGHEVSPRGGHLLVFGTEEVIGHHDGDERAILDAVAAAGGLAIPAHPFSEGSAMSRTIGRPHGWSTFDHPAVVGVEAWSLTTDTAEGWRTPLAAARDLRSPVGAALRGPPERNLRRWDAVGLPGLGGLDAHAPGVRVRGRVRSVMPHARWMGLLQTVLWLDAPLSGSDGAADEALVLGALRYGATALAVPPLGDPLGARFADGELVDAPPGTAVRERAGRLELWRPDSRGEPRRWLLLSRRG